MKLSVMQGRTVSCPVNSLNPVQYFPHLDWKKDLKFSSLIGFKYIEWTVNKNNLNSNPIYSDLKILRKTLKYNKIKVSGLTFDYILENPFFKKKGKELIFFQVLKKILINLDALKVKIIVIPLLDQSSIKSFQEEKIFINKMKNFINSYNGNVKLLFESDYSPKKLLNLIKKFNSSKVGINYDTGNSAYFNYNFYDEKKYFKFVKNIHIKDRLLKGKTVRLGSGNWNYKIFFKFLKKN